MLSSQPVSLCPQMYLQPAEAFWIRGLQACYTRRSACTVNSCRPVNICCGWWPPSHLIRAALGSIVGQARCPSQSLSGKHALHGTCATYSRCQTHHQCLQGLTPAGAVLPGACCRHGIDQVPAHAVREAAADLRQAQRDAERIAQWLPQTEASEDVVLSASQSAAQARQHNGADGSLGAAASSFKAGPLDQVKLQPHTKWQWTALPIGLAGLAWHNPCMCTASGKVPGLAAAASRM